jgi:hypothetical protein
MAGRCANLALASYLDAFEGNFTGGGNISLPGGGVDGIEDFLINSTLPILQAPPLLPPNGSVPVAPTPVGWEDIVINMPPFLGANPGPPSQAPSGPFTGLPPIVLPPFPQDDVPPPSPIFGGENCGPCFCRMGPDLCLHGRCPLDSVRCVCDCIQRSRGASIRHLKGLAPQREPKHQNRAYHQAGMLSASRRRRIAKCLIR